MAKRRAGNELTHDNWDQEEEAEEAGTFQKASHEALQRRVVKKAKRRVVKEDQDTPKNVFSGFSCLSNTKMPEADFSFLKKFQSTTETTESPATFKSSSTSNTTTVSPQQASLSPVTSSDYQTLLEALNRSYLSWIKEHVEKDPCCILTPTFADYEKHLADIEKKKKDGSLGNSNSSTKQTGFNLGKPVENSSNSKKVPETTKANFTFGSTVSSESGNDKKRPDGKPVFTFGSNGSSESAASSGKKALEINSTFKFGATTGSETPSIDKKETSSSDSTPKFSFGSGSSGFPAFGGTKLSFSFGSTDQNSGFGKGFPAVGSVSTITEESAEDEDEPPKVEVKEVKEEGAIYSIRCKLFFKKEGSFKEKGVGMLHLKSVEDKKTQMVIRADTNLGNILLNILLQADLPIQRVGKNNVMVVCIPNPPLNPKEADNTPVPMLIRVKTADDADNLLDKLKQLQK